MTEDKARLAHMAGQIAAAFHALPEEQAAQAVAAHVNQFWTPRMRRRLAECEDLPEVVRAAVTLFRKEAVLF